MNYIKSLTLTDYSYLHKRLRYHSSESKYEYLFKCVEHLSIIIKNDEMNMYKKEDYLDILQNIDDNFIGIEIQNYPDKNRQLKLNTLIILNELQDINNDPDYELSYLRKI